MAKMINGVLSISSKDVEHLLSTGLLNECKTMLYSDEFLAVIKEILEERTGKCVTPIAFLRKFMGDVASLQHHADAIGFYFCTSSINFVFEIAVPRDSVILLPYSDVCRLSEESCNLELQQIIKAELNSLDGKESEDVIGFIPELHLSHLKRFAVMNSDWEIEDKAFQQILPIENMKEFYSNFLVKL